MDVVEMTSEIDAHGFDDTPTADKVSVINDVYFDICSREPWPFLEVEATATIVAGAITNPTNINAILSMHNRTDGYKLDPIRLNDIDLVDPLMNSTSKPRYYYSRGETFRVHPANNVGSDTYAIHYIRTPVELASNSVEADILIPARHQRVLVLGTLFHLYAREDDPENSDLFERRFEKRINSMRNDLWKNQYDRPDRIYDVFWDDDVDFISPDWMY